LQHRDSKKKTIHRGSDGEEEAEPDLGENVQAGYGGGIHRVPHLPIPWSIQTIG
jgi:hypothetical protein